ncbi:uncharacterized protein LOC131330977 [Rhododendron vialii]|uniref:uncharacterized protein LOC131330977 n=1 Tax=Rhododendron vialii TaxID=182163 RepID=UPI00265FA752|nr:uncharacterized protein LOC131330977 [Rhododendron vialii]
MLSTSGTYLVGLTTRKKQFWEQMDDVVQEIPFGEKLFIGGDFNGHVGVQKQGYEKVYGGFGFGDLNEGDRKILDFAGGIPEQIELVTWYEGPWYKYNKSSGMRSRRPENLVRQREGPNRGRAPEKTLAQVIDERRATCEVTGPNGLFGNEITEQRGIL